LEIATCTAYKEFEIKTPLVFLGNRIFRIKKYI
jgi:hypothetical protein